jgi:predicted ArsR family transcriptional regulator
MDERQDVGQHAALASPVRRRVLAELEASPSPLVANELAGRLDLHVTTVRFHLQQLERVGLVERQTGQEHRRGRPSVLYRATRSDPEQAREQLILALAEVIAADGPDVRERALDAGQRWATSLNSSVAGAKGAITDVFARLGFDPEPGEGVIRLRACPFRGAARAHPDVVCRVHLGLARRLAARYDDGAALEVGLLPFTAPNECLITLTRTGEEQPV